MFINVINCLYIVKFRLVLLYWWDIDLLFWLNGWNSKVFCVLFSLIFVFLILNLSWMFFILCMYLMFIEISLFLVNLRVLLIKLFRICCMCNGLLIRFNGMLCDICWISFMCFFLVCFKCSLMVWFISVFKLNCVDLILSLFVFIFEKLSMLLIIFSRVCDVFFIWIRFVCWFLFFVVCCESLVRLIMVLSGVWILWFMCVRKLDFVFVVFWRFWVSVLSVLCCWWVLSYKLMIKFNERIIKLMKYSWNVFCFFCIRLCCFFNWLFFFRSLMVFFFLEIESCMWLRVNNFDCCLLKFFL